MCVCVYLHTHIYRKRSSNYSKLGRREVKNKLYTSGHAKHAFKYRTPVRHLEDQLIPIATTESTNVDWLGWNDFFLH